MTMTDASPLHLDVLENDDIVDRDLAARLADMTSIAETFRRRAENLAIALESNRQIGTAIGLIMGQYKLDQESAFQVLVRLSQNVNRKVHDLAAEIIAVEEATYQMPATPTPP